MGCPLWASRSMEKGKRNMKKFIVYMDDGKDCFKETVLARNEQEAMEHVRGNGEVISMKVAFESYTIDSAKVRKTLEKADFDEFDINTILIALENAEITEGL